jgi:hypothetical protein
MKKRIIAVRPDGNELVCSGFAELKKINDEMLNGKIPENAVIEPGNIEMYINSTTVYDSNRKHDITALFNRYTES